MLALIVAASTATAKLTDGSDVAAAQRALFATVCMCVSMCVCVLVCLPVISLRFGCVCSAAIAVLVCRLSFIV